MCNFNAIHLFDNEKQTYFLGEGGGKIILILTASMCVVM